MPEAPNSTTATLRAELLENKKLLRIAGQDRALLAGVLDKYGDALPDVSSNTLLADLMEAASAVRDARELATPASTPTADFVRPRGALQ